jgi:hypothetical protein
VSASAVSEYLLGLGAAAREVAPGEWGLSLDDVGGWPLHVGVSLRHGMLRAQAEAVGPGQVDEHELLFRNRSLRVVRYAHTGAGAVWVLGDLPEDAVTPAEVDRLLGLLVDAARAVREVASV